MQCENFKVKEGLICGKQMPDRFVEWRGQTIPFPICAQCDAEIKKALAEYPMGPCYKYRNLKKSS